MKTDTFTVLNNLHSNKKKYKIISQTYSCKVCFYKGKEQGNKREYYTGTKYNLVECREGLNKWDKTKCFIGSEQQGLGGQSKCLKKSCSVKENKTKCEKQNKMKIIIDLAE